MNTNSRYGLVAVLFLITVTGWAAELPTKLAGQTLGTHVRPTKEGKCPTVSKGTTFGDVTCAVTKKTHKLWAIDATYSDETFASTSFASLVDARQKKYGPPTKTSEETADCCPGCNDMGGAMKFNCAIWENSALKMTLRTTSFEGNGMVYTGCYLTLVSKSLKAQNDAEAAGVDADAAVKSKKRADRNAEKALEGE